MRLIKLMMVSSIFVLGLAASSCKKEEFSSRETSGLKADPIPEEPVDPTFVVFDNCELVDGWNVAGSPSVDPVSKKQGNNSVKATIDGGDALRMQKKLTTPIDLKLTKETAQLKFWLYVEDVAKVKVSDGQIEVTSSGDPDAKEYAWSTNKLVGLKTGWNEVKLNFKDADVSGDGGANLATVNFFRIYMNTTAAVTAGTTFTMAVDNIGFLTSGAAPGPSIAGVFDNCDSDAGWEIVGPKSVETAGKKEGTGYLKSTITTGEDYMHYKKALTTAVNPNVTKATGQLSFWFFVGNVADIKSDGQIEISSSGNPDSKEYAWSVGALLPSLKNGWNEVKLNFRDAEVSADGEPNLAALNFFRIFFWTKDKAHADVVVGVDDIKFLAIPPPAPVSISFDNCDSDAGWEIVGPKSIETAGKKEGTGYLKSTITTGEDYMHYKRPLATPVNSTLTKANGQLKFWFFVANVADIKSDGQIELTSSGNPDSKEYAWSVGALLPSLKNGWNEVKLNFSDAEVSADGETDLASVNFFRVFFWTKDKAHSDLAVGVDDIRLISK